MFLIPLLALPFYLILAIACVFVYLVTLVVLMLCALFVPGSFTPGHSVLLDNDDDDDLF